LSRRLNAGFESFGHGHGYCILQPCRHWAGGGRGAERNGMVPMLCARDATPLAEEVTGSKRPDIIGPGQLALEWWVRWGGGMGTGSEREGGGVFFTADLC
jgi:hypothetical protein